MADTFIIIAVMLVLATCVATLVIAILRPVLRRFCGAPAVLRLWWIIPLTLVAIVIPKHSPPRWLETPILVSGMAMPPSETPPAAHPNLPWKAVALLTWLFGAAAMAGWLCLTHYRFTRTITWGPGRRGALPPGTGPAVVGAIMPRLALPSDFESRFSPIERKLILLHETIHMRRRDGIANLGMSVLLVSQWFNPALHWASRAMCRDQECACDALVVSRHPGAIRSYANALLKSLPEMRHLPLVCRWQAYHPTVERIAMLKLHRIAHTRTTLAVALLVAGSALASTLLYASRPTADLSTDAAASEPMYRVAMVLSRDGKIIAQPKIVARQNKPFSIVAGSEKIADTPDYRYGITMVASPQSQGIGIEGEIEFGVDRTVVARPRLIVAEGKQASIEINDAGGSSLRLELIVNLVSAAEFEQMKNQRKK